MPLFTRCNIGLGCPQNVSVKFQPKIPHRSFIITAGKCHCDEWGGAESRGNGARPVELMMMSYTCTTHRSRVPRRSSGRIKGGVTTVEDERGLDFSLCFVCGSRPWGAEEVGQHGEAETASGCPRRWCWNDGRSGWNGRLAAGSWVEEGWLSSKRERRSRRRSPRGRSLLPSAMSGEEQGTGDSLPAALDWRSHRRLPGGGGAVGRPPGGGGAVGRPPKMSSTIAWHREWEPLSWLRTERQCVGEPDREFFFSFFSSLPSLVSVSPHPSVSFSPASSVLTPRYATAAVIGSPPERGEGGSRAQSREYPRPARGDGGMWRVGRGREPWERSEAGGVNDDELHLHHSPVSSPTEELRKDKRRSDDSGRRERTRPGL